MKMRYPIALAALMVSQAVAHAPAWSVGTSEDPLKGTASASVRAVPQDKHFLRGTEDSLIKLHDQEHIQLDSGSILLKPYRHIELATPHTKVFIKRNATVLVCVDGSITHVFDLHDDSRGAVSLLNHDKKRIDLGPGKEAAVVKLDDERAALECHLQDGVRRRRLKSLGQHKECFWLTDEFSILDVMLKHDLLSKLRGEFEADSKRVLEMLIKTAAAVSLIDTHEPYAIVGH